MSKVEIAKMGMRLFDSGAIKDSRIPVCEKGNGPSSLRQIQRSWESASAGRFVSGQTMESSSAVRVIEVKLPPFVAQSGTGVVWVEADDGVETGELAEFQHGFK